MTPRKAPSDGSQSSCTSDAVACYIPTYCALESLPCSAQAVDHSGKTLNSMLEQHCCSFSTGDTLSDATSAAPLLMRRTDSLSQ